MQVAVPRTASAEPTPDRRLKGCVAYATINRPQVLRQAIEALRAQSVPPVAVIVSCVKDEDVAGIPDWDIIRIVKGPPGSAAQRNLALDSVPDGVDVVAFMDDDFVPHPDWLGEVLDCFARRPDVGAVTGDVIGDGITGPGITFEEALGMIASARPSEWIIEGYSPYGCNMAVRLSAVGPDRFDERLVLYGWLEDRDLGARVARKGYGMVKIGSAQGVHLGVKGGRVPGVKFGYSQVVNPIYMNRKGTMKIRDVVDHIFRNCVSNLVKSARPEPYVDRMGRLRGNLIGFLDVLRGRLTPERARLL